MYTSTVELIPEAREKFAEIRPEHESMLLCGIGFSLGWLFVWLLDVVIDIFFDAHHHHHPRDQSEKTAKGAKTKTEGDQSGSAPVSEGMRFRGKGKGDRKGTEDDASAGSTESDEVSHSESPYEFPPEMTMHLHRLGWQTAVALALHNIP